MREIIGRGDLDVRRRAFDQQRLLAQPFERLRLIGGITLAGDRAIQRFDAACRSGTSAACRRARPTRSTVSPISQRQAMRQHGDGLRSSLRGRFSVSATGCARYSADRMRAYPIEQAIQIARRETGPGRVMHQHPVRLLSASIQRRERIPYGLAALAAALAHGHRGDALGHLGPPLVLRGQRDDGPGATRIHQEGVSAHSMTVRPRSGAYCLGMAPDRRPLNRGPAPAAGMTSQ